ncbi:ABC transporter ATP-binding protein [Microbacterium sp. SA39]|uniref:ABC transporter ATP-binding protein n=1 Tax=Microbacterium sp. SA39 TaxID=1263625 RepID=UPI0005FA9519|nr:ABC transporter ATP-binding protein [Microbacterium sp. SA39]KJQ52758.1 Oligopeptide transport ATP-binding protein OppF [Microbacterium sp. SA39]
MTSPLLDIEQLVVRYRGRRLGKNGLTAVDRVGLTVGAGEVVALVGESGCGKSTLARAVVQLERPESGTIRFDGRDVTALRGQAKREYRRSVSYVFQDPLSSLSPRQTVGEAIEEPMIVHRIGTRQERRKRVGDLLSLVGAPDSWFDRRPASLSGGQRQRVAIARSLALSPQLLVCDEPLTALDVSTAAQIAKVFTDLQRELSLAYLFIGHDLGVVRRLADRVAVMHLGQIVEVGASDRVLGSPAHPYTRALVDSIPVPDPAIQRQRVKLVLRGEVPSPLDPPSGCRFRTRCPHAFERCATEEPALREVPPPGTRSACHLWDRADAAEVISSPDRAQRAPAA